MFALVTFSLLNNNNIDTVLLLLNKKYIKVIFKISGFKMKLSKLCCEKSLVIRTKLGVKFCAKAISTWLHGIIALFSHADGTKHKERLPNYTTILFFKRT